MKFGQRQVYACPIMHRYAFLHAYTRKVNMSILCVAEDKNGSNLPTQPKIYLQPTKDLCI